MDVTKQISSLKKEATSLKKTDLLAAATKIKEALNVAIRTNTPPTLDLELRYAAYLYDAGKKDDAFNEIARLTTYGPHLDKPILGSAHWYSDQETIMRKRIVLLAKEKSKQAYAQLISDSLLALRYEAMFHVRMREDELARKLEYQEITESEPEISNHWESTVRFHEERLKWIFDFGDERDLNSAGWKAFKALNMTDLEHEYRQRLKKLGDSGSPYDISELNQWVQLQLNERKI